MSTPEATTQYTAKDITVLEGLDAVRKRPAMYIGDTAERGLHHLLYEVIDNSIDEAMAGHCDEIRVTFHKDGSASVRDNGRGIPVDKHAGTGLSALEVVLTKLHAGGKFEQKAYHVSGGLHGVGVSVVNALSVWLEATVKRDGKVSRQRYERGKPVAPVELLGKTTERGTLIHFKPDVKPHPDAKEGIMELGDFQFEIIVRRVKELAYLNQRLKIVLRDERAEPAVEETFQFEDGLGAFVKELNLGEEAVFPEPFIFHGQIENLVLDGALQYVQSTKERILTFANNINTEEGGTHLEGFKAALTNSLKQYAKDNDLIKEKSIALAGDDVREGLTAVIAVKIPEPQFEGQTKTKLGTSKVKGLVQQIFGEEFHRYLEEKPAIAKAIVNRCVLAARARTEARKAADLVRKSALAGGATLPGKLTDCITRHREEAELFIVEGDSAAGSAKTGRNSQFQAILPIKGKILNVEKATLDRILSNEEIKALVTAIGTGINTETRQEFRADKLRYGRVIIMSDADVDGAHIRTLLLTFFFRYMRPLIDDGRIYIAQPPLYKVKKGKAEKYILNEKEKNEFFREHLPDNLVVQCGNTSLAVKDVAEHLWDMHTFHFYHKRFRKQAVPPALMDTILKVTEGGAHMKPLFDDSEEANRIRTGIEGRAKISTSLVQVGETPPVPEPPGDGAVEGNGAASPPPPPPKFTIRAYTGEEPLTLDEWFLSEAAWRELEALHRALPQLQFQDETVVRLGEKTYNFRDIENLRDFIEFTALHGVSIQRFKGLGEMNADELADTTMDPKSRTLLKVRIEDAAEAEAMFQMLMGSDVEPRKRFIIENAFAVQNLDI